MGDHGALRAGAQGPVSRSFRCLMELMLHGSAAAEALSLRSRDGAGAGPHFGLHRPYRTNQIYLKTEYGRLVASQSDLPKEAPLPLPSRAGPGGHDHAAPESR